MTTTTTTYEWPDRETWEAELAGFRGLPPVSTLAADHCTPEEIANELVQLQHEIQKLEDEIEGARVELEDCFGVDIDALREAANERHAYWEWDDDLGPAASAIAQRLGLLEDHHRSLIWAGRRLLVDGLVPNTIPGSARPEYLKRHPVLARYYAAQVQAFHVRDTACAETDEAWEAELDARARTEAWLAS